MAVGASVTVAALAGGVALALSTLENRPQLAADWIEEQLGREVRLREMVVAWDGASPVLRLRGLEVGGADGLSLDDTELLLDPFESLRARALRPAAVTVRGAAIALDRDTDGTVTVVGLGHAQRATSGKALGGTVGRALGGALSILPASTQLRLDGASITLTGFAGESAPMVLSPVTLRLHQAGSTVRVSGTVASAGAPATPARFSLRWPRESGNPLEQAELTFSVRELALSSLPAPLWRAPLHGRLSVDLEGSIANGRLHAMRGTAALERPRLAAERAGPGALSAIESLVEFRREGDDWRVDLLRVRVRAHGGGRDWPATSARIAYRDGDGDTPWHVEFAGAPLADLLPVLHRVPLSEPALRTLRDAVLPHGRVEDVALRSDRGFTHLRVDALRLRDLRLRSADGAIEAGPLDAALTLEEDRGRLSVSPGHLRVRPAAGGEPLDAALGGDLAWQRDAGGLALASTGLSLADGESRLVLRGRVRLPAQAQGPAMLDLSVRSDALQVDALRRYLALPGLPAKLRAWLAASLDGGVLSELETRIVGEAATSADAARLVEARARMERTTLRYRPDWPALDVLSGEVTLSGGALGFQVSSGTINGARIVSASGGIRDVTAEEPVVEVTGRVAGSTVQATGFITASPLGKRFPGLLPLLDARGRAQVDVRMDIPIGAAPIALDGSIRLLDNTLGVPGLRSPLTGVTGSIGFDRDGLGSGTLEARYLDRHIDAELDGRLDGHERTRLTIRGRTDPDGLRRHLYDVGAIASDDPASLPLLSRLDGETAWQVVMDIPHRRELQREGIGLTVSSDLDGMALRLPAPLGKAGDTVQRLEVRTRLAQRGERVFHVGFGERIRAVIRASAGDADGEDFGFERGELRFGGAPASLPAEPGLRVTGAVTTLSVDEWVAFIALATAGAGDGAPQLTTMSGIEVSAERLDVLGAAFDEVALAARREASGAWRIAVRGEGLDGVIDLPLPIGRGPIDARFERLHVRREALVGASADIGLALEPGDMPPARLVVQRLLYNDVDLGVAKMTLSHGDRGLLVEELVAVGENLEVRGSGSWSHGAGGTASQLDLRLHSGDFGALTAALGFGDSGVEGGVADIALHARWQGSPFDLALDRIDGDLSFRAGGGRLRDVEPGGAGRMFGLLNLTVLPRRLLRLDFSDLFEEGVSYQSLTGSFRLSGGNAWTEDVTMETENARVDLVGRVGLVAEDYEQVLTVTPKVSSSLPLAPLWLAEKFLNRKLIDSAFSYRYIITGTWSDPHIERERVEAVPTDAG